MLSGGTLCLHRVAEVSLIVSGDTHVVNTSWRKVLVGILSLDLLWILLNSKVAGPRWELVMVLCIAILEGMWASLSV